MSSYRVSVQQLDALDAGSNSIDAFNPAPSVFLYFRLETASFCVFPLQHPPLLGRAEKKEAKDFVVDSTLGLYLHNLFSSTNFLRAHLR